MNPKLNLDDKSDDYINGVFSTLQSLQSTVTEKSDSEAAQDFKTALDVAATGGHEGESGRKTDEEQARLDAELEADVNKLFSRGAK